MTERAAKPRVVLVTRKTQLQALIERHGTKGQAEYYLRSRDQDIAPIVQSHERFCLALSEVEAAIPPDQRRTRVQRDDLDRFLFAPDDLILVVGQDGLVPNVAKYLTGQLTFGINPDPQHYDGVLCTGIPADVAAFVQWIATHSNAFSLQERTMVSAQREDGQIILGLNEVFIGHRSHQSARYVIRVKRQHERQSSSGVICSTGTGCTGWVRSIVQQRGIGTNLPRPGQRRLAWFVREPFPSISTDTQLDFGILEDSAAITLTSEMADGGAIFADGLEADFLDFLTGQSVTLSAAPHPLKLAVPVRRPMN